MKNRLSARIADIKKGALNAHVVLDWKSIPLSVVVTTSSVEDMGLAAGKLVDVFFRASDVIVASGFKGSISARNILRGRLSSLKEGFPLALAEADIMGESFRAELTLSSLREMGLKAGDEVDFIIKSSELVLSLKEGSHGTA